MELRTVGVEEELLVVDPATRSVTSRVLGSLVELVAARLDAAGEGVVDDLLVRTADAEGSRPSPRPAEGA